MTKILDAAAHRTLDVASCRSQFPALAREIAGQPVIYFDGPAGSQVPGRVAEAVRDYLLSSNANSHGAFATSQETDDLLDRAHAAVADLVGSDDPATVVFGPNMTTLTFALSRALARTWRKGDEVIVTRLDHDANVSPWVLAARDAGAVVRHIDIHRADCTLDMDDLRAKLSERTRLVAVGCASNAVGSINPVGEIVQLAHDAGAEVFLDAVHYAPHALIDVASWQCDFIACSAYKFFGPHVGVLWGRRERLESLEAYKVRPASDELPSKWMNGTQNHEGIAGMLAAIEYLEDIGRSIAPTVNTRRERLSAAYRAIGEHERTLAARLLDGLEHNPSVTIYGVTDPAMLDRRVPTVSITHARMKPQALAAYLGERGIFVWHGNYYALPLSETLGLEPDGMVRVGLLHYNTQDEVQQLLETLPA